MKKSRMEKEEQLYVLEEHLADALKPITPPTDLVARMRERIRFPQTEEIVSRLGNWKRLLWIYAGVMSSFLVMVTVARAFYYFVNKR